MREKLYISVPEPCHEDWNKMTPVEQGRYCGSCKKNVVDFSGSSDEEVIDFFKNYNGSTCGRFSNDQLNRPIEVIEIKKSSSFLKYAAGLLLPAMMIGNRLHAQQRKVKELNEVIVTGNIKRVENKQLTSGLVHTIPKDTFQCKPLKPSSIELLLSGKNSCISKENNYTVSAIVIDESDKTPLVGVSVFLKGSDKATVTDEKGVFALTVSDNNPVLIFKSVGYIQHELPFNKFDNDVQTVKMSPSVKGLVVVGFGVIRKKNKTGTGSIKIQHRTNLMDTLKSSLSVCKIKAYPNPVKTSGSLEISFGNVRAGIYHLQIVNAAGQLFYSFQKQIASKNDTEHIYLNEKMAAGIYFLQITNEKKKLIQTSKIIVQE
jgi:CarboxypepD_reg-like domain/Secretion system C-terminal sorting domain